MQNAMHFVPEVSVRSGVTIDLRSVFNAPDRHEADRLLAQLVSKYQDSAPDLSTWLESNVPEGLIVFELPATHRRRLRTSNMLERVNREIERRTRVATLFPNEASLRRLVSAILGEISDDWETGKVHLTMPQDVTQNATESR